MVCWSAAVNVVISPSKHWAALDAARSDNIRDLV
jgi:hypothetical protein